MGDTDDSGDGPDEVECPKRKPKTCKACAKVDDKCFEESEKLSAHCEKLCSDDDNDNDNNDDNDNDNDVDEEKPKCPKKPKSCKACQNADEQCMEDDKFAKICQKLCDAEDNDDGDNDTDGSNDEDKPKCPRKPKDCEHCQRLEGDCAKQHEKFCTRVCEADSV